MRQAKKIQDQIQLSQIILLLLWRPKPQEQQPRQQQQQHRAKCVALIQNRQSPLHWRPQLIRDRHGRQ